MDPTNQLSEAEREAIIRVTGKGATDIGSVCFLNGWLAAREFYAPNMDETNRLRKKLGLDA